MQFWKWEFLNFGEMHELADMAQPDIMVITNIGLCHLENLENQRWNLKSKDRKHLPI